MSKDHPEISSMVRGPVFDFYPFCSECQSCCKLGERYFVFVSLEEIKALQTAHRQREFQKDHIMCKKKNGDCVFLSKYGCTIPSHKPMDCYCYPVMPLWEKDEDGFLVVSFLMDLDCPASLHLPKEWVIGMMKYIRAATSSWMVQEKEEYTGILKKFIFKDVSQAEEP